MTDEGCYLDKNYLATAAKLHLVALRILLIYRLSLSLMLETVRTQVATLIRLPLEHNIRLNFNAGNLEIEKYTFTLWSHLPPNHGGRPWCRSPL